MDNSGIFEKVKSAARIREVAERFGVQLDRHGKARCPFHKEDTPSFSIKESENIFKCFGCGASGDAVDFVAKIKGVELIEAAQILADFYGIDRSPHGELRRDDKIPVPKQTTHRGALQRAKTQIKEYASACIASVGATDYYKRRGLTDDTIRKFRLGFDAKKQVVVIPYSSKLEYYQTRSVDGKEFRKPKTEDAGAEPLYNADALTKGSMTHTKGVIFIVESPLCAMSIMQCGGAAIATCGTSGIHKLVNEIKARKPECCFVLALDNDEPGQAAQKELAHALFEANVKFITYNVAGPHKDPNELLMAAPKALAANVKNAADVAKKQYSKLKKLFSASELQARDMKPIQWIVHDLLPEGLALICAPSKYGKSWLMMQLCLAVSQGKLFFDRKTAGCDCAYFALEDSERRFKTRLNKLLNGEKAPSNFYGAVVSDSMANGLFEQLTELLNEHPRIGLIIIDTFQKVRTGAARNESVYGADYREMGELKAFADKHGVCILLVHHVRKQIDDADIFNMINGSMAIMGAADTAWILSRKKRDDVNTTLKLTGRDVENTEIIISFDKHSTTWNLVGNAEDEAVRLARAEYDENPIIKTIKALVEKNPIGWRGTSSEIKVKIYEETGVLYNKSPESIGRTIRSYADRLLADGITHQDERGKRHLFAKKQPMLFGCRNEDD